MTQEPNTLESARAALTQGQFARAKAVLLPLMQQPKPATAAQHMLGVAHLKLREFAEAERWLRATVEATPNDPIAWTNLAAALLERGNAEQSVNAAKKAVALRPDFAEGYVNLSAALLQMGRAQEACDCYTKLLTLRSGPAAAGIHLQLAGALGRLSRYKEAEQHCRQALQLNDKLIDAYYLLSCTLRDQTRYEDAIQVCEQARRIAPNDGMIHYSAGCAMLDIEDYAQAEKVLRKAVEVTPHYPLTRVALARALRGLDRLDEAEQYCRDGIARVPASVKGWNELGVILMGKNRVAEAEEALLKAMEGTEHRSDLPDVYNNLGTLLAFVDKSAEAVQQFGGALKLKPDFPAAQFNRGLTLLRMGRFDEGWADYELRHKMRLSPKKIDHLPKWDGRSDLAGKRVMLVTEQGFGDTMQFCRYASLLTRSRGARAILACQKPLVRLLKSLKDVEEVVSEDASPPPEADLYVHLLDLPRILGTRVETIPGDMPYLWADEPSVQAWRERLAQYSGPRIGLVWSANPTSPSHRWRSMTAAQFAPLLQVKGASFFSLQVGEASRQLADLSGDVVDLSPHLTDFAETAAAMMNLDLLITVDTAVVHLAGALDRPVWALVPFAGDWRWLETRADTPWYPTARLFRQPSRDGWPQTVEQAAAALREFVER
jgi:tetratricopeptide (TPR) repeat protein/ADP-heptose:LPS heptosyltransferase